MKVLIIAESDSPNSGWGRYAYEVRKELNKSVKVETLITAGRSFFQNLILARKQAKGVDLVHAFDVWPFAVYGYFAVLGTKKKLFITGVGTYSVPPHRVGLKRLLMIRALKKAKAIFCISNFVLNKIKSEIAANLVLVHMGRNLLPEPNKRVLPGNPKILTVGQLKDRKGQLDTLKAVNILKNRYPEIIYYVVGSTQDKHYLRAFNDYVEKNDLEKNVVVNSAVRSDDELANYYTNADVFVMNSQNSGSHFEGFGLVFLEAMQFGKPVVGSRNSGIEDAIQDGYNGFLTNQGDPTDIAEKLELALKMDKHVAEKDAHEFASRFSWTKTVETYIKYYRE